MSYDFICPKCNGQLRVEDQIIFSTKTDKGTLGLILLNPEVGNYKVVHHPSYKFESGETIDFYCPICHTSLTSDIHKNLAEIKMIDADAKEYKILFSKIAGEKSTFKLMGESCEAFGEHSKNYEDLMNLIQMR